ncbi:hypothetical protein HMPREF1151_1642 [Veillonella sp. ACP1]|nr:hypothetical protein HMPREF1151_1642 [Veillonella sp. ACP1]
MVYSDSLVDQYINDDSIYIIKSTAYLVSYKYNTLTELDNTYYYDYSNNVSTLLNKTYSEAEFGNQVTKYNYDGELYEGPKIPKVLSPAYEPAIYSFYKSYNMYFNLPSEIQKF